MAAPVTGTASEAIGGLALAGAGVAGGVTGTASVTIGGPAISGAGAVSVAVTPPPEEAHGGMLLRPRGAMEFVRVREEEWIVRRSISGRGSMEIEGPSISGRGVMDDDDLALLILEAA